MSPEVSLVYTVDEVEPKPPSAVEETVPVPLDLALTLSEVVPSIVVASTEELVLPIADEEFGYVWEMCTASMEATNAIIVRKADFIFCVL